MVGIIDYGVGNLFSLASSFGFIGKEAVVSSDAEVLRRADRLILRRRWEYWVCATALHKLGVILIPATLQLTKKDIVYRGNAAEVKAVICVDDDFVVSQMEASVDRTRVV